MLLSRRRGLGEDTQISEYHLELDIGRITLYPDSVGVVENKIKIKEDEDHLCQQQDAQGLQGDHTVHPGVGEGVAGGGETGGEGVV